MSDQSQGNSQSNQTQDQDRSNANANANANAGKAEAKIAAKEKPALTKAEVVKRVQRQVVVDAGNGKTRTVCSKLTEDEILDFKDYGTHIVVVTVAGEKFSNAR